MQFWLYYSYIVVQRNHATRVCQMLGGLCPLWTLAAPNIRQPHSVAIQSSVYITGVCQYYWSLICHPNDWDNIQNQCLFYSSRLRTDSHYWLIKPILTLRSLVKCRWYSITMSVVFCSRFMYVCRWYRYSFLNTTINIVLP